MSAALVDRRPPSERRAAPRRPARLFECRLVDAQGRFVCDARVRDLSETGARLALIGAPSAPPDLLMFDETRKRAAPARLVWRAGAAAGLELQPWRALEALPVDVARRLRAAYYAAE
jgi:hypothetical protein